MRVEASTFETNRAHLRGDRSSELGGNIMAVLLLEESRARRGRGLAGRNVRTFELIQPALWEGMSELGELE